MRENSPPVAIWGLAGKVKNLMDRMDFVEEQVGKLILAVAKLQAEAKEAATR